MAPAIGSQLAPSQTNHWNFAVVAAGLKSQLWACSVSPDCGSDESPGDSTAIEAVEDWLSPGSVPGFAPAAPVIAL